MSFSDFSSYRIGMRVRCLANGNQGKEGTVVEVSDMVYIIYDDCSQGCSKKPDKYYKIISPGEKNKPCEKQMSLIARLMLSIKSEPEKSFIKTGVANQDGTFTCEGKELFLNWLLQDKATKEKFYDEVVKPLLAEMKEEKDCNK